MMIIILLIHFNAKQIKVNKNAADTQDIEIAVSLR